MSSFLVVVDRIYQILEWPAFQNRPSYPAVPDVPGLAFPGLPSRIPPAHFGQAAKALGETGERQMSFGGPLIVPQHPGPDRRIRPEQKRLCHRSFLLC